MVSAAGFLFQSEYYV